MKNKHLKYLEWHMIYYIPHILKMFWISHSFFNPYTMWHTMPADEILLRLYLVTAYSYTNLLKIIWYVIWRKHICGVFLWACKADCNERFPVKVQKDQLSILQRLLLCIFQYPLNSSLSGIALFPALFSIQWRSINYNFKIWLDYRIYLLSVSVVII